MKGPIRYLDTAETIGPGQLTGFFEGWPTVPSPEVHLSLLRNSDEIVLAEDMESGAVVGFVTAVTDHVLCAYIPLLEVLPAYRHQGIGRELVRRLLNRLEELYMVDLLCDPELQPFYETIGMRPATGMSIRRFDRQGGRVRSDLRGGSSGDLPERVP